MLKSIWFNGSLGGKNLAGCWEGVPASIVTEASQQEKKEEETSWERNAMGLLNLSVLGASSILFTAPL